MSAELRSDDITHECWLNKHSSCTGYTEPETDAELCNCQCHDDAAAAYLAVDS